MVEWRLGNYELRRRLGEGGMAQVYLARDVRLGREVAVKVLDRTLADRPGFRERFMREARVAAALDHPNIVPLFDFGDTEALFLVMPYVSGGSLQDVLPRAPLPIGEVVTYGSQIADALEYAHHRKVVHRDVKPANMLIHADGRLMLSDFGLAKIVNATSKLQAPRNRPDAGTPEYMAPEQVVGNSDARSDIYGLGVVLYLLLTGRLPFSGSTSHEVMQAHLYKDPKPVRAYNPSVPLAMEAVVMRAMAKEPSDRFQRAGELGAALLSALIADANDAPTFVLGGGPSSQGGSRPTGQAPIVLPPPVMPEQPAVPPPWRQRPPSGPVVDAASLGDSQRSGGSAPASAPRVSEWGSRGSQRSSSSLTGILPELNTPFTGLDARRGASSGAGPFAGSGHSGAPGGYGGLGGGSFGGASGATSGVGGYSSSQTPEAPLGPISASTLGRMPAVPPSFPGSYPSASSSAAPDAFSTSYAQPMQPMQPMQRPIMSQMDMTPTAAFSQAPAAPQQQRSELRATLPGSRLSEPPAKGEPRVRSSRLWIVIGVLLIILLVAVVVLLRWLEAGSAAFTLLALV
ncbi:MAG TPA: serine/threonine-protein kinase [Ktedonobacterales bacterium]